MTKLLLTTALLAAALVSHAAVADQDNDRREGDKLTIAVFGDWPYSTNLLNNAPLLINSVNSDRDVSLVLHVGDIHSGSMACTGANLVPLPTNAVPGWNQGIYFDFQQFKVPFVYTPGDNEWTDCHKSKEFASGDPLKELASVRTLFFARPGKTLGLQDRDVVTQAAHFDPAFPADAQFVENVMWEDNHVVFVTVNMPGSNNDSLPWTGAFANAAAQANEIATRTDADIRWLRQAFRHAESSHAKAVVIGLQADVWDPAAVAPGGDGLDKYTPFVQALADVVGHFRKPVLLLNGDSHLFGADHPLAVSSSPTGVIHHVMSVPNLTRITVQGSTNAPAEWLRLTIDPNTRDVFSWRNVPYCNNPLGSC